jgi:hypothetical protein
MGSMWRMKRVERKYGKDWRGAEGSERKKTKRKWRKVWWRRKDFGERDTNKRRRKKE